MASPGEAMDWTPTRPDAVQVAPVFTPITQPNFNAPAAVHSLIGSNVMPSAHNDVHSNLLEYTNSLFPPSMRLQGAVAPAVQPVRQEQRPAPHAKLVRSRQPPTRQTNHRQSFSLNKSTALKEPYSLRPGNSLSRVQPQRQPLLSTQQHSTRQHLFGPTPQPNNLTWESRSWGWLDRQPPSTWVESQSRPRAASRPSKTVNAHESQPDASVKQTAEPLKHSSNSPRHPSSDPQNTNDVAQTHQPTQGQKLHTYGRYELKPLKPVVPYFSLPLPPASKSSDSAPAQVPSARRRTFQEYAEDEPEAPLGRHPTSFDEVQSQIGVFQWVRRKVQVLGQRLGKKIASLIRARRSSQQSPNLQHAPTASRTGPQRPAMPGSWPATPAQDPASLISNSSLQTAQAHARLPPSMSLAAQTKPATSVEFPDANRDPLMERTRDIPPAHNLPETTVQPPFHSSPPDMTVQTLNPQLQGSQTLPTAPKYSSTPPTNATESLTKHKRKSFSDYPFADPRMRRSKILSERRNNANSRSEGLNESKHGKSNLAFAHSIQIEQSQLKQLLTDNKIRGHTVNGSRKSILSRPSLQKSNPNAVAEGEFSGQPIHIYPSHLTRNSIFQHRNEFDTGDENSPQMRTGGGRRSSASSSDSLNNIDSTQGTPLDYSPQIRASLDMENTISRIPSRDSDGTRTLREELEFFQISEEAKRDREARQAAKERARAAEKARREAEARARKEKEEAEAARLRHIEAEKQKEAERQRLAEEEKKRLALPKIKTQIPSAWEEDLDKKLAVTTLTASLAPNLTRRDLDTLLPQGKLTDSIGWLNDEIVNSFIAKVIERLHAKAGFVKSPSATPPYHAFNTFFYSKYAKEGYLGIKRWMERAKIHGDRLLRVKRLLIPINHGSHWTLIDISGTNRTITYYDSLGGNKERFVEFAKDVVRQSLGDKWVEADWTVLDTKSPRQTNGVDCGVFVCLNGLATLQGAVPIQYYREKDIPAGRRMIAAVLLHGGFQEEFDL